MAPPVYRKILGPRGVRRLDPSAPLYVRRRIPLGPDADGVLRWLEPGQPFDAASVKPLRLQGLFSSRHIAHERPGDPIDVRGRDLLVVDAAPTPLPTAPDAKPPKRPRAGA